MPPVARSATDAARGGSRPGVTGGPEPRPGVGLDEPRPGSEDQRDGMIASTRSARCTGSVDLHDVERPLARVHRVDCRRE